MGASTSPLYFPSKTFLLGEYAILEQGRALLLAHGPAFREAAAGEGRAPHPESPAGRWLRANGRDPESARIADPHGGAGGFGASGAEFLLAFAQGAARPADPAAFAWSAYDAYRAHEGSGSGADVITQAFAAGRAPALVEISLRERALRYHPLGALGAELRLFHTGRKLDTHTHLTTARAATPSTLATLTAAGLAAYSRGDLAAFATTILEFRRALKSASLLAPHAAAALGAVDAVPGVLAAKGCGAMGNDVLLVLVKDGSVELAAWAEAHRLRGITALPI